jgi:hypothetical protein
VTSGVVVITCGTKLNEGDSLHLDLSLLWDGRMWVTTKPQQLGQVKAGDTGESFSTRVYVNGNGPFAER